MARVLYHLPHSAEIIELSGKLEDIRSLNNFEMAKAEGFVINRFDDKACYFLQPQKTISHKLKAFEPDPRADIFSEPKSGTDKANIINSITSFQKEMVARKIEKAIFARTVNYPVQINQVDTFSRMVKKYPGVFCYFFQSEETGSWMGATPEKLFDENEHGKILIHSLAGTQPANAIHWTEKEYQEQQLVTNYISSLLQQNGFGNYSVGERETIVAGAVAHLRTTFTLMNTDNNLDTLVRLLHPTPAVCGTPKDQAFRLIQEWEGLDREFYAGYLGPIGKDLGTHLFVNLRCMKLYDGGANLYVGGGITAASVPEKEWEETELKSQTLLSVIST